jgi:hypothetical protein
MHEVAMKVKQHFAELFGAEWAFEPHKHLPTIH